MATTRPDRMRIVKARTPFTVAQRERVERLLDQISQMTMLVDAISAADEIERILDIPPRLDWEADAARATDSRA